EHRGSRYCGDSACGDDLADARDLDARRRLSSRTSPKDTAMSTPSPRRRMSGFGRVLVIFYAIMALAATGRSIVQILRDFEAAPLAYTLSFIAAFVYIVATLALVFSDRPRGHALAWIAI